MTGPRLRPAARGLVVDADDRLLLCRLDLPHQDVVVWTAPGGGVEPGEDPVAALHRELDEEVGLAVAGSPVHVWHQEVVASGHVVGYDGAVNDYFLVRADAFEPRGSFDDDALAAESITCFRWWTSAELAAHDGPEVFGPRDLPALFAELLRDGAPAVPRALGL